MIPEYVEENSGREKVDLFTYSRVAAAPTTVEYQIDCLTSGAAIRAAASLTPGTSVYILITPADTTLQSQDNSMELREITVTADLGLDTQFRRTYQYKVVNKAAVT